jgi:hypothetical protein
MALKISAKIAKILVLMLKKVDVYSNYSILVFQEKCVFSCMKWIITIAFFTILKMDVSAQTVRLKRKYLKEYQGEMTKYSALIGKEMLEVSPAKMVIKLDKDSLFLSIGNSHYTGVYTATKSTDKEEVIVIMDRDNSKIPERFILNKKNKTIVRKGIFPQPDAYLNRSKKSGKG